MRGEKLIYKLTAKGFSVSVGSGGPVFISMEDIAAGMRYGNIHPLEYHLLMALVQPPVSGDRVIQLRLMAKPKDRKNPSKFDLEEAYQYLIERYIAKTDLDLYFWQHMAGVAADRKWRLKRGKPVTRYFGRIVLIEKLVPWLCTCIKCKGRGEVEHNNLIQKCKACTGERQTEGPTGEQVYIGSGIRKLSGRSMARLLDLDQKSYQDTWKNRRETFELELDQLIKSGLNKLANTVFEDWQAPAPTKAPKPTPEPSVTVKRKAPVKQRFHMPSPVPNHRAVGRPVLSLSAVGSPGVDVAGG